MTTFRGVTVAVPNASMGDGVTGAGICLEAPGAAAVEDDDTVADEE